MDKVVEFLKSCGAFFYASCDGDKPRVRPFGFFMVFKDRLYFGMGKQKESFRQTVENPNFEICALNKDNAWIRIRGTAVLDDSREAQDKAFETSPFLKNIYNEQTGNVLGLFYIKDGYAEIANMTGGFEKFNF